MVRPVLLNNQDHQSLKYQQRYGEKYGHRVGRMVVFPNEIRDLHVQYPLLFGQSSDGLQLLALFGFSADENLFLEGTEWQAHVVPLLAARGPFMIGFQSDDSGTKSAVVHVDVDDDRVTEYEGESLFLPQGGASPLLQRVQSTLKDLDEGLQHTANLVQVLQQHELIQPLSFEATVGDQSYRLEGYFAVDSERLSKLDGAVLAELSRTGVLPLLHWLTGSLANISRLADLKMQRQQHG